MCTATVTVEDNIAPTAICQNAVVQLDANGMGSITASDIDNGSTDACGIASLMLDVTAFGCAEVGMNTVTLTVTDENSNVSMCTATVTVGDNVAPTAICQNAVVQLDADGMGSITASDIDNGSTDACGIASLMLDVTAFGCAEVGMNTVTLTVTDENSNVSMCTATVTVEDN
ncbi:subtilisin, partial [Phaeodactylibacter luteus]